jgi:cyclophilin family peptidyl-prolyl cis-trans isomerase
MAPKKQKKRLTPAQKRQKSNRTTWIAIGAIVVVVVIFGVLAASGLLGNRSDTPEPIGPTKVLLETTAGNITIDLRTDKPITSGNFIKLVKEGKYDGSTFHRTIASFMIQGGKVDGNVPAIKDEIGTNNRNTNYTIAMATQMNQQNSATSEFFINIEDNGQKYNGFDLTYTVFGNVIEGKDVVDAIANADVTESPYTPGEMSVPVNPVTIIRATIIP